MPEPFVVFLGDTHVGSTVGLGVDYTDQEGRKHTRSATQRKLEQFWKQALEATKAAAIGCEVTLCLGGDLVDGDRHHGTRQTAGTMSEQVNWAVELLEPWHNLATYAYGLRGTEAHVGANGEHDMSVCEKLEIPTDQFWRLEIGGKVVDWAHHATGSRLPWTSTTAPTKLAVKTSLEYLKRGERVPDVIVRHHLHFPNHVRAEGIDVVSVPGWQSMTDFSYKLDPNGLLSVGVAWWWPERDVVKVKAYPFPAKPITIVGESAKVKKLEPAAA